MKFLLIALALLVTMPTYTNDQQENPQAKVQDLLNKYKSREVSPTAALERENIQLKNEVRDLRRKLYVAEQQLQQAKSSNINMSELYTEEQVQAIIDNAYTEMYAEFLAHRVAERNFLLSLKSVEQGYYVVTEMNKLDHEQLTEHHGNENYKQDIDSLVTEYTEYFGLKLKDLASK